jgi:hypothetical protein
MKQGIHPFQLIHGFENWLVAIGLFLMAFFPIIEIGSRVMGIVGLTGTTDYVRHLTLWGSYTYSPGGTTSQHTHRD